MIEGLFINEAIKSLERDAEQEKNNMPGMALADTVYGGSEK